MTSDAAESAPLLPRAPVIEGHTHFYVSHTLSHGATSYLRHGATSYVTSRCYGISYVTVLRVL